MVFPGLPCLVPGVAAWLHPLPGWTGSGWARTWPNSKVLAFAEGVVNLPFPWGIVCLPIWARDGHAAWLWFYVWLGGCQLILHPPEAAKSSNYLNNSLGTEQYLGPAYCTHSVDGVSAYCWPPVSCAPAENTAHDLPRQLHLCGQSCTRINAEISWWATTVEQMSGKRATLGCCSAVGEGNSIFSPAIASWSGCTSALCLWCPPGKCRHVPNSCKHNLYL